MHQRSWRRAYRGGFLLVALTAAVVVWGLVRLSASRPLLPHARALPLRFEPLPAGNAFAARGADYLVSLSEAGAELRLGGPGETSVVRIRVLDAAPARPRGSHPLPALHHYLRGRDPAAWRIGVPTYGEVRYPAIYPGIDLAYHGHEGHMEYDFIVAPGADPGRIRLAFEGADHIAVNGRGELVLRIGQRRLVQPPPRIYQATGTGRRTVAGGYVVDAEDRVSFRLAAYDRHKPLVIDPVLVYASYLGGDADERVLAMTTDAGGNLYLVGITDSTDLATSGALDGSCGSDGACDRTTVGGIGATVTRSDIFVTRMAADGTVLYTTYLGGGRADVATAVAVDALGQVTLAGHTRSTDYPVTTGAFDSACSDLLPAPGGDGICDEGSEAVITRLAADGASLVYSTYLGGNGDDQALGLALDAAGNAYVTGATASSDFPVTTGAFATDAAGLQDAFVAKLDATGSTLDYAAYLGGSATDVARDIAVDTSGNAYVTGYTASRNFPTVAPLDGKCGATGLCDGVVDDDGDGTPSTITTFDAFVAKVNPTGSALVYSTYLGGERYDYGNAIVVDAAGRAYVAGETRSTNFSSLPAGSPLQPALAGSYDGFVTRLNAAGSALDFFTYLGGGSGDVINDLAVDASGDIYVTGSTFSRDFPTAAPFHPSPPQRLDNAVIVFDAEAFIARLDTTASSLRYASLFGGQHNDYATTLALGGAGQVYFAGYTFSADLAVTDDARQASHRNDTGDTTVIASDSFLAHVADGDTDLTVTLEDAADPIDQGGEIAYTARVRNQGGVTTRGVRLRYDIPQDTDLRSYAPSQGSCSRNYNTLSCDLGTLAPAAEASVAITIRPRGAGAFQSQASVTALASDSNAADNVATATTQVTPPFFSPSRGGNGALGPWLLAACLLGLFRLPPRGAH
ncbi:MAG TPA: DUF11 domain-containing protein [Gammaproteobacteria bacterium]|nr:DUF11 domain-containing protein [Gammaproteobacteria bacterium]